MIKGFYAILDLGTKRPVDELLDCFIEGGGKILQLRGKNKSKEEIFETALRIIVKKKHHSFTFIINDHPDIAIEIGADGVHVGDNDPSPEEIRSTYNDKLIIGKSTHSLDEVKKHSKGSADYLAFGAIYQSPSKNHDHPVQGIDKLRKAVSLAKDKPLVAIGGITRDNIDEVIKTNVSSVAMISSWCNAKDVTKEVKWWVQKLNQNQ